MKPLVDAGAFELGATGTREEPTTTGKHRAVKKKYRVSSSFARLDEEDLDAINDGHKQLLGGLCTPLHQGQPSAFDCVRSSCTDGPDLFRTARGTRRASGHRPRVRPSKYGY
mmetsp:Transcript_57308/g.127930  ORF Transcript_57308/g.127930 Transcript_57308/m.127930 type:complete len:112 (-) Transcript_57308:1502-1837(-)